MDKLLLEKAYGMVLRTLNEKRIPPNSLEAEQSIIGSILIDADAIVTSSGIITSKDFYQPDLKIFMRLC